MRESVLLTAGLEGQREESDFWDRRWMEGDNLRGRMEKHVQSGQGENLSIYGRRRLAKHIK